MSGGHPERRAAAFALAPVPLAVLELEEGGHRVGEANAAWTALLGTDADELARALARRAASTGSFERDTPVDVIVNGRRFTVRSSPMADSQLVLHLEDVGYAPPDGAADEVGDEDGAQFRHVRDLVDNATALMYVKDTSGRYLMANQEFTRRFGMATQDIVGRTDHDIYPVDSADAYAENDLRVLATGVAIQTEEPYGDFAGTEDPSRRWVSIKFPLVDAAGAPYALGAISTDITDRKRAEDAVSWARLEAERANRRKDEFLSRMSHELRTPLNAILGFAQLLRLQRLDASAIEQVEHIAEAGRHLLSLVNDALDISWIEAGSPGMRLSSVSAAEPIHQALKIIRPLATARDIEIASDLHGAVHRWVVADPQRLRQVFLNLLGNAVKFNRPQGFVRVSCRAHPGVLRYRITDTGPGLPDDQRELLFAPFSRLPGAEGIEGSGLGLALSRRLIERMGGRIGLERSAPGEGSTFYVDVPIVPGEDGPAEDEAFDSGIKALPQVGPATVVQIEDTVANSRLVEAILAAMGEVRVHSAPNGEAGLALVERVRPDLVLLDLNLPDLPGTEVLKRLHGDILRRGLKVIVLSADATPARIEELRTLGVSDYITKPVDVHNLATAISELLTS